MTDSATCKVCRRTFRWQPTKKAKDALAPRTCGVLRCVARDTWDLERWQGAARMARSREACGIPLSGLDRDAVKKVPHG